VEFQVEAKVRFVPCAGLYRFDSVANRLDSSRVFEYIATIRLAALSTSAKGRRCGKPLPRGAGDKSAWFSIVGAERKNQTKQIRLHGRLMADSWLHGRIDYLIGLCPGRYRLQAHFARTRDSFTYDYIATVINATVDGRNLGC
jgi:hypothetical protein